ncbi:N-(5'-phosphoribosyl)anthranilate isomerase, partial [bacterium]|nr:N-(5'-phosphoribosyl)anthranilate isomerase [bacterium]
VAAIVAACRLDLVQLHGGETDADVAAVAARTGRPVIKVMRAGEPVSAAADYLLFDLAKGRDPEPGERDRLWEQARSAVAAGRRVFLAGRLRTEEVTAAIAAVAPHALDVSGGVESAPGRKDAALVRGFVEEVRRARP